MSKIRAEIEGTMKEVEELRDQREKQNQLLESVRDERDTYKKLMHQAEAHKDAVSWFFLDWFVFQTYLKLMVWFLAIPLEGDLDWVLSFEANA